MSYPLSREISVMINQAHIQQQKNVQNELSRKTISTQDLDDILSGMPEEIKDAGVSGHCDAFAVALTDFLASQGVESHMILITRKRWRGSECIQRNDMSHVVIQALNTSWDVYGSRADEKWEEEWEQPKDSTDEFYYHEIDRAELEALRHQVSRRVIHPVYIMRYREILDQSWQHRSTSSLSSLNAEDLLLSPVEPQQQTIAFR